MRRFLRVCVLLGGFLASPLWASGMTLHIWMAEMAANEFVQIPELRSFLLEQDKAYQSGSIFPDSGYAIEHPFGEYSHWEDFLNSYYQEIKSRCPKLDSPDCRQAFAHMLGVLAHDIGDVNFDRYFVTEVARQDQGNDTGKAQSFTDPGCDLLAILEHKRAFRFPEFTIPHSFILSAFERGGEVTATPEDIYAGAAIQKLALVGEPLGSPFAYFYYKSKMPWGSKNYLTARGGVVDTARRIAFAWQLAWIFFHSDDGSGDLFQALGGWDEIVDS